MNSLFPWHPFPCFIHLLIHLSLIRLILFSLVSMSSGTRQGQHKKITLKNQPHLWTDMGKSWMKYKHHFHWHSVQQNIVTLPHLRVQKYNLHSRRPLPKWKLVLTSQGSHFPLPLLSNQVKISHFPYCPLLWCALISSLKGLELLQTPLYREVSH